MKLSKKTSNNKHEIDKNVTSDSGEPKDILSIKQSQPMTHSKGKGRRVSRFNPLVLVVALVGTGLIAGAAWLYMQNSKPSDPVDSTVTNETPEEQIPADVAEKIAEAKAEREAVLGGPYDQQLADLETAPQGSVDRAVILMNLAFSGLLLGRDEAKAHAQEALDIMAQIPAQFPEEASAAPKSILTAIVNSENDRALREYDEFTKQIAQ